jgi:hypothetical protein
MKQLSNYPNIKVLGPLGAIINDHHADNIGNEKWNSYPQLSFT